MGSLSWVAKAVKTPNCDYRYRVKRTIIPNWGREEKEEFAEARSEGGTQRIGVRAKRRAAENDTCHSEERRLRRGIFRSVDLSRTILRPAETGTRNDRDIFNVETSKANRIGG
jgi:hypothetical protein